MNIYVDKDSKFAWAEQTAFGTKVVTSMTEMEIDPFQFKPAVNNLPLNRAHQQRYKKDGDIIVDQKGVMHELSLPEVLAKKDELDQFLYMVYQNVTEGATTPFDKTFNFGQTQPDFSADAGHFMTFGCDRPIASEDWTLTDCICRTLNLACAPNANNGYLTMQPDLVGRIFNGSDGITSIGAAADGAVTDFFNWHDLVITLGGSTMVKGPNGIQIAIGNTAGKIGGDSSSYFENYVLSEYTALVTVQMLYDSNTATAFSEWQSGTVETALVLQWGSDGVDGNLKFTARGKQQDADHDLTPEGDFYTLVLECTGTFGSAEPLTSLLENAVDRGW